MVHAVVYRGGNTLVNGCLRGSTSPLFLENGFYGGPIHPLELFSLYFAIWGLPKVVSAVGCAP